MTNIKLNLTRKLRSKTFDQIVGQTLTIRMLKNSLYLGHYFPVYLFSGQRGCGKTTTARVFAAALNCAMLQYFQKNPKKQVLPCMECDSCNAMATSTHPDFIEMDAASHTGVESVRYVIDAASLLPVMGTRKIYLIDEAHMLSRAAFNALLKILEEPPANVMFILATTDVHKIIDTVKSRCFQLLFKAVEPTDLVPYLQSICVSERIPFDLAGLMLIAQETSGSVRDALNIVEQVRLSAGSITSQSVLQTLNHVDDHSIIYIIKLILAHNGGDLILFLKESNFRRFSAEYIWRRFIELIRTLIWIKYGVKPEEYQNYDQLEVLVSSCQIGQLCAILKAIYDNEETFLKTTAQHVFLEMFFVLLCQQGDGGVDTGSSSASVSSRVIEQDTEEMHEEDIALDVISMSKAEQEILALQNILVHKWRSFIESERVKQDALIYSVLSQGVCVKEERDIVVVQFAKDLALFESIVNDARAVWYPYFVRIFAPATSLNMCFIAEMEPTRVNLENKIRLQKPVSHTHNDSMFVSDTMNENTIDISDVSAWETTHMVLRHFPGSVHEVRS